MLRLLIIIKFARPKQKKKWEMTEMLTQELELVGLHLNTSKSKVITNDTHEHDWVDIGGEAVDILNQLKRIDIWEDIYFGTFPNRVNIEINARLKLAWFKFGFLFFAFIQTGVYVLRQRQRSDRALRRKARPARGHGEAMQCIH